MISSSHYRKPSQPGVLEDAASRVSCAFGLQLPARSLALALALYACCGWAETVLYVATNGYDQWTGQLPAHNDDYSDGPFATLERARDRLRVLKQAAPLTNGATVYVRGGTYYRANTFELDMRDAGLSNAPIVYKAYANETPVLNGTRPITDFAPWRGPILQVNVAALGFTNTFRQLFFNAHRQQLARYPNFVESDPYRSGWAYVEGTPTNMYVDLPDDRSDSFKYKAGDVRFWARPQEVEVSLFPRYNWFNDIISVSNVDMSQRVITLADHAAYAIRPGDRYFVRNVFEELDSPGEWYLDSQFGVLYFWPPCATENPVAYAPAFDTHMVVIASANINMQGFSLEAADGTAIGLHGATDCKVIGCTIRNVGGSGVAVFGDGNSVVGNDIYSVGNEGIRLEGGVQRTLTSAANSAENNYVHHVGVFYKWAAAITIGGVGNAARYNLIHDCPRSGIMLQGNLNLAEYNLMYHVNLETDDTGGIYSSGPDWISTRGNIIRYNCIYDSQGFGFNSGYYGAPYFAWGIYLDLNAAAVDVLGNIVADCSRGAIMLNNGRDNLICNNILLNCAQEQLTYTGWRTTDASWHAFQPQMMAAYGSVSNQPVWQALRGMNVSPAEAPFSDGLIMASNQFWLNILAYSNAAANLYGLSCVPLYANGWNSNLFYHNGQNLSVATNYQPISLATWQRLGLDSNSIVADPLFMNAAAGDYRLQAGSPALGMGFKPIPVDQIGLYPSPMRASWPFGARPGPGVQELKVAGIDIVIRVGSLVGHGYQLERSDTLSPAGWRPVGQPQDGTGDVLAFTEPSGATAPEGYYRIVICP